MKTNPQKQKENIALSRQLYFVNRSMFIFFGLVFIIFLFGNFCHIIIITTYEVYFSDYFTLKDDLAISFTNFIGSNRV